MKVLSCNVGYLLNYTGELRKYVLSPHRAVIGSEPAEIHARNKLLDVIASEEPDIVCLVEVDQGSIRTALGNQVTHIADCLRERGLRYHPHVNTKYGDSHVLAQLPILQNLANGFLFRADLDPGTTAHYLDTGPKRLVDELSVDGLSVFSVHLAMSGRARRRQLDELAGLVAGRDRVVVCGDFNAYNGHEELDGFVEESGLVLHDPGESVPERPLDSLVTDTRSLDIFLVSPDVEVTRCETIDVQISDHRPVVLEFRE